MATIQSSRDSSPPRHSIDDIIPAAVSAEIRRLELKTRRAVDSDLMGNYRSAFRGSGLIYSDVREYVPGDDVKHIHWNATARTGRVYVKSFDEDRQLRILVAVDISNSTNHGTTRTKHLRALEFAATIALLAQRSHDAMGLCLFGGEVISYLQPKHSRRQFQQILLRVLEQRELPRETNIQLALDHILRHQRRGCVVFLVSDFQTAGYEDRLRALAVRHDVVGVLLEDRLDFDPPAAGIVEFFDAETGRHHSIDTSSPRVRRALTENHARRVDRLSASLQASGADFIRIRDDIFQPLRELMQRRRSRLR